MPDLLRKLKIWRQTRPVGHFFSAVDPGPNYLKAEIVGGNFFKADAEEILQLMPSSDEQNILAKEYMTGILKHINAAEKDRKQIDNLRVYLDEKDRRRGTNWKTAFPWLTKLLDCKT
jgi:hypothetical protein